MERIVLSFKRMRFVVYERLFGGIKLTGKMSEILKTVCRLRGKYLNLT